MSAEMIARLMKERDKALAQRDRAVAALREARGALAGGAERSSVIALIGVRIAELGDKA